jgi:hypothetical protein
MAVRTHELKSWSRFFRPIVAGERAHELRRNDRDYSVGGRVILREYDQHHTIENAEGQRFRPGITARVEQADWLHSVRGSAVVKLVDPFAEIASLIENLLVGEGSIMRSCNGIIRSCPAC